MGAQLHRNVLDLNLVLSQHLTQPLAVTAAGLSAVLNVVLVMAVSAGVNAAAIALGQRVEAPAEPMTAVDVGLLVVVQVLNLNTLPMQQRSWCDLLPAKIAFWFLYFVSLILCDLGFRQQPEVLDSTRRVVSRLLALDML